MDLTFHTPKDFKFANIGRLVETHRQALVRIVARGPLTDHSLTLPEKPTRVELNPLESVLAEVRTEAWRH